MEEAAILGGLSISSFQEIPAEVLAETAFVNVEAVDERPAMCETVRKSVSNN